MNEKQEAALRALCKRYGTEFRPEDFRPAFDLPAGWVAGRAGPVYVGVSPEGEIHS